MTRKYGPTHLKYIIPFLCASLFSAMYSCKMEEQLKELDLDIAGPIDVVQKNGLFYVLNSDFDRRYKHGSILIIDPNAEQGQQKKKAIPTSRMGRSLHMSAELMLATFDQEKLDGQGLVQLRRVSDDGLDLPVVASWSIDCSPINGIISPKKRYLVVSCLGGDLWAGRLNEADPSQSSLQLVRSYRFTRRAIYIHETDDQAILFGFPTDMGEQRFSDLTDDDLKSYDPNITPNADGSLVLEDGANEVPDAFEKSASDLRRLDARRTYQMIIYDLKGAAESGFPFVDVGTLKSPTIADLEHKYLYYNLKGRLPDQEFDQPNEAGKKFYHTNFWEAKADPLNADSFLVSQRGIASSAFANNVIRVTINEPSLLDDPNSFGLTSTMFSFERVFGFSDDNPSNKNYPGDFEVFQAESANLMVVNNFRDAVYWAPGDQNFALSVKSLAEGNEKTKPSEFRGDGFSESVYQLATDDSGTVVSCSFYGNTVLIFDLKDDATIALRSKIEN